MNPSKMERVGVFERKRIEENQRSSWMGLESESQRWYRDVKELERIGDHDRVLHAFEKHWSSFGWDRRKKAKRKEEVEAETKVIASATGMVVTFLSSSVRSKDGRSVARACMGLRSLLDVLEDRNRGRMAKFYTVAFRYAYKSSKTYLERRDAIRACSLELCERCVECGLRIQGQEDEAILAGMDLCGSVPEVQKQDMYLGMMRKVLGDPAVRVSHSSAIRLLDGLLRCSSETKLPLECMQVFQRLPESVRHEKHSVSILAMYRAAAALRCLPDLVPHASEDISRLADVLISTEAHLKEDMAPMMQDLSTQGCAPLQDLPVHPSSVLFRGMLFYTQAFCQQAWPQVFSHWMESMPEWGSQALRAVAVLNRRVTYCAASLGLAVLQEDSNLLGRHECGMVHARSFCTAAQVILSGLGWLMGNKNKLFPLLRAVEGDDASLISDLEFGQELGFLQKVFENKFYIVLDNQTKQNLQDSLCSLSCIERPLDNLESEIQLSIWAVQVSLSLPRTALQDRWRDAIGQLSLWINKHKHPVQQWQHVLKQSYEGEQSSDAYETLLDSALTLVNQKCGKPESMVKFLIAHRSEDELTFSLLLAHIIRTATDSRDNFISKDALDDAINELENIPQQQLNPCELARIALVRASPFFGCNSGTSMLQSFERELEKVARSDVARVIIHAVRAVFLFEQSHHDFTQATMEALEKWESLVSKEFPSCFAGEISHVKDDVRARAASLLSSSVDQDLLWAGQSLLIAIVASGNTILWTKSKTLRETIAQRGLPFNSKYNCIVQNSDRNHLFCGFERSDFAFGNSLDIDGLREQFNHPVSQIMAMERLYCAVFRDLKKGKVMQALQTLPDVYACLERSSTRRKPSFQPFFDLCTFMSDRLSLSIAALLAAEACSLGGLGKEAETFAKKSVSLSTAAHVEWLHVHGLVLLASIQRRMSRIDAAHTSLAMAEDILASETARPHCSVCKERLLVKSSICLGDLSKANGHVDDAITHYEMACGRAQANRFPGLTAACLLQRAKCHLLAGIGGFASRKQLGRDGHEKEYSSALKLLHDGDTLLQDDNEHVIAKAQLSIWKSIYLFHAKKTSHDRGIGSSTKLKFWGHENTKVDRLSLQEKDSALSRLLEAYNTTLEVPLVHKKVCGLLAFYYGNIEKDCYSCAFFMHLAVGSTFRFHLQLRLGKESAFKPGKQERCMEEATTAGCGKAMQNGWQDVLDIPCIADPDDLKHSTCRHFNNIRMQCPGYPLVVGALFDDIGTLSQHSHAHGSALCPSTMLLVRIDHENEPLVVNVELPVVDPDIEKDGGSLWLGQRMEQILKESNETVLSREKDSSMPKSSWWKKRLEVERKMSDLVTEVDEQWLGVASCMFQDGQSTHDVSSLLRHVPGIPSQFLSLLAMHTSRVQKTVVINFLETYAVDSTAAEHVYRRMTYLAHALKGQQPSPVAFVAETTLQVFPWESFPSLVGLSLVRSPSVFLNLVASSLLQGDVPKLDLCKSYYLLDPEGNLPATTEAFDDFLRVARSRYGWSGLSGQEPSRDALLSALEKEDFFIYIGHGVPKKYLPYGVLQNLRSSAAAILMGCSSARLQHQGCFEASGYTLAYLMLGCPFVMGNLWDVTDRDIDRFSLSVLHHWLDIAGQCKEGGSNIPLETAHLEGIARGRKQCRLPYLNGAAPVCYGVPCRLTLSLPSQTQVLMQ